MYTSTQNKYSLATSLIETESRNTQVNSQKDMAVMASDGPSPHPHSLRLGLAAHKPSRPHHAQSLLRPSFHDPRLVTPHFLESHPERGAPLSRRDDERRHAVGSHSAFALRLNFAACNPSSSCRI